MRPTGGVPARTHCVALKSQQGKPRCQDHGSAQRDEATPVNARRMSEKTSMQPIRVPCDWIQTSVGASQDPAFPRKRDFTFFFLWE